jgi:hypothetical protein
MAHSRNAVVADDRLTHPWVRKQAHRAALASVVTVRPIDTHVGAPALFTVTCDCEVLVFVEVRWRWDLCAVTLRARRPRCNNEQCAPDRGSRSPAGARSESYRKIGALLLAGLDCLPSVRLGRAPVSDQVIQKAPHRSASGFPSRDAGTGSISHWSTAPTARPRSPSPPRARAGAAIPIATRRRLRND